MNSGSKRTTDPVVHVITIDLEINQDVIVVLRQCLREVLVHAFVLEFVDHDDESLLKTLERDLPPIIIIWAAIEDMGRVSELLRMIQASSTLAGTQKLTCFDESGIDYQRQFATAERMRN